MFLFGCDVANVSSEVSMSAVAADAADWIKFLLFKWFGFLIASIKVYTF